LRVLGIVAEHRALLSVENLDNLIDLRSSGTV